MTTDHDAALAAQRQIALEDDMIEALRNCDGRGTGMPCLEVAADVWVSLTGDLPERLGNLPARFGGYGVRLAPGYGADLEAGAWRVVDQYGNQLARSVPTAQTALRTVDAALRELRGQYGDPDNPLPAIVLLISVALISIAKELGVEL